MMGILASILLIVLVVAFSISLFRILIFGIGVGVILALVGLVGVALASVNVGGLPMYLLYLMIKLFTTLLVVSVVAGIIVWIKDTLVANY